MSTELDARLEGLGSKDAAVRATTHADVLAWARARSAELSRDAWSAWGQSLVAALLSVPAALPTLAGLVGELPPAALSVLDVGVIFTTLAAALATERAEDVVRVLAEALGRLATLKAAAVLDVLDGALATALTTLSHSAPVERRLAAALLLGELAQHAPSRFYLHGAAFMHAVWGALHCATRDALAPRVRQAGAVALRHALAVFAQRESPAHAVWYGGLLDEMRKGWGGNDAMVHGSVLALSEALRVKLAGIAYDDAAAQARFRISVAPIHKAANSGSKTLRMASLLAWPLLAAYTPHFTHSTSAVRAITQALRSTHPQERSTALTALGGLAAFVTPKADSDFVPTVMETLLGIQSGSRRSNVQPALQSEEGQECVRALVSALPPDAFLPYVTRVLSALFAAPLSFSLVRALARLARKLPAWKGAIHSRLLSSCASSLAGQDEGALLVALRTLPRFPFAPYRVSALLESHVLPCISHAAPDVRLCAVTAAVTLLPRRACPVGSKGATLAHTVLYRAIDALHDASVTLRERFVDALLERPDLDATLAQAHLQRSLFAAFQDEQPAIREKALTLCSRVAVLNPGVAFPRLRWEMERLLDALRLVEPAASLVHHLRRLTAVVAASRALTAPYVTTLLDALRAPLSSSHAPVAAAALDAVAAVAANATSLTLTPHATRLLPEVFACIHDLSSSDKRIAALRAASALVRGASVAVAPLLQHSALLPQLLAALRTETEGAVRVEMVRLLGVFGALDPFLVREHEPAGAVDDEGADAEATTRACEEHYATCALNAVLRILTDASLVPYHRRCRATLVHMFSSALAPHLGRLVPVFLAHTKADPESALTHLTALVKRSGPHITPHVHDLVEGAKDAWKTGALRTRVLALLDALCEALGAQWQPHVPDTVRLLHEALAESGHDDLVSAALRSVKVLGVLLSPHLHVLVPVLVLLLRTASTEDALGVHVAAVVTELAPRLDLAPYASSLMPALLHLDEHSEAQRALTSLYRSCGARVLAPWLSACEKVGVLFTEDEKEERDVDEPSEATNASTGVSMDEARLRSAWDTSARASADDWHEWLRGLSLALLRDSPSPSLRACHALTAYGPLVKELFHVAFLATWSVLRPSSRTHLIASLQRAFSSPELPVDLAQALLDLAEFMEQEEQPLPLSLASLARVAEHCRAFAKALHYHEQLYRQQVSEGASVAETVASLLAVNTLLGQTEAAHGILHVGRQQAAVAPGESALSGPAPPRPVSAAPASRPAEAGGLEAQWYERLGRYEEALRGYEARWHSAVAERAQWDAAAPAPAHARHSLLGLLRCLQALGQWEVLGNLCTSVWHDETLLAALERAEVEVRLAYLPANISVSLREEIAALGAKAEWSLGYLDAKGAAYTAVLDPHSLDGAVLRAVLHVQRREFGKALAHIERGREVLAGGLAALVSESYQRAYALVVTSMELSELEEMCTAHLHDEHADESADDVQARLWSARIAGLARNVDAWRRVLRARALVLPPSVDRAHWLHFSGLCRRAGRFGIAQRALERVWGDDDVGSVARETFARAVRSAEKGEAATLPHIGPDATLSALKLQWAKGEHQPALALLSKFVHDLAAAGAPAPLRARAALLCGQWMVAEQREYDAAVAAMYEQATQLAPQWHKAWRVWALHHYELLQRARDASPAIVPKVLRRHTLAALHGFVRSLALAPLSGARGTVLQDALLLLALVFDAPAHVEAAGAMRDALGELPVEHWLHVVPQLIARLHAPSSSVRSLVHTLLVRIAHAHPHAIVYALTVAEAGRPVARSVAAQAVLQAVRAQPEAAALVAQAQLVGRELVRVSILWPEQWHEGLEDASRHYFGAHDVPAMLATLAPLHAAMQRGPETAHEAAFHAVFAKELGKAHDWCQRAARHPGAAEAATELNHAWDVYYHVFRRIDKQLASLTALELPHVSPALAEARDLAVAVPGTYRGTQRDVVRIAALDETLKVFSTKQRPRRLTMAGSDGQRYAFLLKGHEDLRQDERVMQLFALVNALLKRDEWLRQGEHDHAIVRYAVVPLSANSGLIGWVPHADTMHQLIRHYRVQRNVVLNLEHRLMLKMAPDYDKLTHPQRLEVFAHALAETSGADLAAILWLRSPSSEAWMQRRAAYTRSLAVMSMVGYVLGLGDRHPSNMMLDRVSGKVVHIDFGDCFEVAMHRDKFPETIPFRLTRMLVRAMEVSGIEGTFRLTCEAVLRVLRQHADGLRAVLDAFVHDPLISWGLLAQDDAASPSPRRPHRRMSRLEHDDDAGSDEGAKPEQLNQRALTVIRRINDKLSGNDFAGKRDLAVPDQVSLLIEEATSHENLCQCYVGWCPFW